VYQKGELLKGNTAMANKRQVEVFSAGCAACEETIEMIRRIACESCEVIVHDMRDAKVAQKAKQYGISSVPAIVIDGKLADCCAGRGPNESVLRAAGLGTPSA
jgi:glutaredoxin